MAEVRTNAAGVEVPRRLSEVIRERRGSKLAALRRKLTTKSWEPKLAAERDGSVNAHGVEQAPRLLPGRS